MKRARLYPLFNLIVVAVAVVLGWNLDGWVICQAHTTIFLQHEGKKERAAALIAEGVAALERQDTNAAKTSFQRALQAEPNNEMAHTYLGVLADRAGNLVEAERQFGAAAGASPASPSAHNNHGVILVRLGKSEQAAREFEISLGLDPTQASALINLAQIRFTSGTPEGLHAARDLFERARNIAPDAEIARALVVIALRLNDREAAATYYRDYLARINGAPPAISSAAMRAELGSALLVAGLAKEANSELSPAVATDPANIDAILLLARSYLALKDLASAGRTLESAVARGIEAAPIYAALAEIYEASGHVENAIPAMRLAIERDPRNESYRFRYGMLLTDTRAPEAAIIRLNEALKEFPQSAKLRFALGVAHFKNHKHDEAAIAFEHAIEVDPNFASALAYLGITYDETGRYSEAIVLYNRALAADDKLAAVHYLLADALLRQPNGDLAIAEKHLTRAVALEPSFSPGRLDLARVYMRTERFEDAATQLEVVVAAEPNLSEGLYQLSRVYMRLKRKEDAQKALDAFKRLSDNEKRLELTERQELVRRLANVKF
jgi:tetratricopeptide (TPR) repeat protein